MIYVLIYLTAIVLANFLVLWFGPKSTIINAFLLIGLDLSLRDKLHDRWMGSHLWLRMLVLIASGSVITYVLSQATSQIAIASVVAFSTAAIADTLIYAVLFNKRFLVKANGSNLAGALVDSALFPTIAFGVFLPWIVLGQFLAKVGGGFVWSLVLARLREPNAKGSPDSGREKALD